MVEESAAAIHTMTTKTTELARLVGQFDIRGDIRGEVKQVAPARHSAPAARRSTGSARAALAIVPNSANAEESWEEF
jgi:hypothetical protein